MKVYWFIFSKKLDGDEQSLEKGFKEENKPFLEIFEKKIFYVKVKNDLFLDLNGNKIFEGNLTGEGSDKKIFDEIIDMYGVVTKILKENMKSFSRKSEQIFVTIDEKKI